MRRFPKVIHPDTQLAPSDPTIGLGVFATAPLPRGTIVWSQDALDRVFEAAELAALPSLLGKQVDRYAHVDAEGHRILCWDEGRYINHACNPSLRGVGPWMQVARRTIAPGDEITCDYAECNIDPPLACRCGDPACRGLAHARDLLRESDAWDAEATELAGLLRSVAQPLWGALLDPETAAGWADGRCVPSFRALLSKALR